MSEIVTQSEFHARLEANELTIALIGMSNMGKSSWSNKLSTRAGFDRVCCDDIIEAGLEGVLLEAGYGGGISDVAEWLGQPHDPRFAENQRIYTDLEVAAMDGILSTLEQSRPTSNTVIDTTGSIVHTGRDICERLRAVSTVVYLEATPRLERKLFAKYLSQPKPVIWGDAYVPLTGEPPNETLARCYPSLLGSRSKLYAEMADVTIPKKRSLKTTGVWTFLGRVRDSLPN
jgi:shikimate kinase